MPNETTSEHLEFTTKANDETFVYPVYTAPGTGINPTDEDAVTEALTGNTWEGEDGTRLYFYGNGTGVWEGSEYGAFDYTVRNGRLILMNGAEEKKTFRFKFDYAGEGTLMLQEKPVGETHYFTAG